MSFERIFVVLFGLPLKIDGTDTKQSIITREFAERFAKESGLEILFQDEAYTTFEAEQMIAERKHVEKDSLSRYENFGTLLKKKVQE